MMLPSTGARSPMFALACSAGFVLIFIFGFMAWSNPERIPFPHSSGSTHVEMYVLPHILDHLVGIGNGQPLAALAPSDCGALRNGY